MELLDGLGRGNVEPRKLERAVSLAVEKYCSARATLGSVEVTREARLASPVS